MGYSIIIIGYISLCLDWILFKNEWNGICRTLRIFNVYIGAFDLNSRRRIFFLFCFSTLKNRPRFQFLNFSRNIFVYSILSQMLLHTRYQFSALSNLPKRTSHIHYRHDNHLPIMNFTNAPNLNRNGMWHVFLLLSTNPF